LIIATSNVVLQEKHSAALFHEAGKTGSVCASSAVPFAVQVPRRLGRIPLAGSGPQWHRCLDPGEISNGGKNNDKNKSFATLSHRLHSSSKKEEFGKTVSPERDHSFFQ